MSMSIPVNTSYLDSGGLNLNYLSNEEWPSSFKHTEFNSYL